MTTSHSRPKRKQHIVDAKMQLAIVLPMLAALVVMMTVYGITVAVCTADDLGPSSDTTRLLGFLVTGIGFALAVAAASVIGVFATQRVAGPARVIENAVRAMRSGDFSARLSLRTKDHLQSLADEVSGLRDELRSDREARQEFGERLVAALECGDVDATRGLIASLLPASETPSDDVHATAAGAVPVDD